MYFLLLSSAQFQSGLIPVSVQAAVCDAVARIPSEDKQLFSTLESSRHFYQADSGHSVCMRECYL